METWDKVQRGVTEVNTDFGNKITCCIKDGGLQQIKPIWPSVLHLILYHVRNITTYTVTQTGDWE